MGFFEAVKTCFSKYADFSGRASRAEFLYFVAFVFISALIIGFSSGVFFIIQYPASTDQDFDNFIDIFSILIILPIVLPSLAVTARRFHDFGISGWWQIAFSIAMSISEKIDVTGILYLIALTIFLLYASQKPDDGENKYGTPI